MAKRPAVFFAVLFLGCGAAYMALDWWTAERPPDDLRDAVAEAPFDPANPAKLVKVPAPPPPMFVAGGIGIMPGMPYALPAAPSHRLAGARILASLDR